MPPIISIIGNSNSGKTILIEKLVRELKLRGYRVATIKHIPQKVNFDEAGRDSWRHIRAESEATAISSPGKIVLIKPAHHDTSLDEVASLLGEDYDIILAEGFKQGNTPKIEVHCKNNGPLLRDIKKLIGIVTDEPLETKTRQFSPDSIKDIANLIENGFIKPQKERISLYVNNKPITLTTFPKQNITSVIMAMVSCLKGVEEIRNIQIFLKKG